VAIGLGYGPVTAWLKVVLPQVYPQIRLPVFAVLAYSVSAVEMAIILGPTGPAPLAVRLTTWMRSPDLALWFKAAAGAVLQLALVLVALALWRCAEITAARFGRGWAAAGGRGRGETGLRALGGLAAAGVTLPVLLGLASLAIWSVAGVWSFPDALPTRVSGEVWLRAWPTLGRPVATSVGIGLAAAAAALVMVLACLEHGSRSGARAGRAALAVLYLPLIVPQVAFLFGLQVLGLGLGLDGTVPAVWLAHLVFVLPYVFLSLSDPWQALDPRFAAMAAGLGARPARVFWRVRLPMMLAPALTAAAVGFAVPRWPRTRRG
jgi:putative thiamine transport system permease protein